MMYKKLVISGLLLFVAASSFAQKKAFEVSSSIENLEGKEVYFTIWNGTSETRNTTVPVVNGQFTYKDSISSPLVIRATAKNESLMKRASARGTYPTKSASMWFIAQPGAKIKLVGKLSDFAEAYPVGDKENDILVKLTKEYFPLLNKEVNLRLKLVRDSSLTAAQKQDINKQVTTFNKEALTVLKKHINANPSSLMALYFINDMLLRKHLPIEEAAKLLPKVENKYKVTGFYSLVYNRVNATKFDVGAQMLEISAMQPDGKMFSNAQLKGKYYLIDFWGSWCGPCMAGMPNLASLKKKYAGKLEILGIDQGDDEDKWKKTIVSNNMDWFHIRNGSNDKDYVSKLNVAGFPTKILVGPDGTILYRTTGENEGFNEKMEQYIAKGK